MTDFAKTLEALSRLEKRVPHPESPRARGRGPVAPHPQPPSVRHAVPRPMQPSSSPQPSSRGEGPATVRPAAVPVMPGPTPAPHAPPRGRAAWLVGARVGVALALLGWSQPLMG